MLCLISCPTLLPPEKQRKDAMGQCNSWITSSTTQPQPRAVTLQKNAGISKNSFIEKKHPLYVLMVCLQPPLPTDAGGQKSTPRRCQNPHQIKSQPPTSHPPQQLQTPPRIRAGHRPNAKRPRLRAPPQPLQPNRHLPALFFPQHEEVPLALLVSYRRAEQV